MSDKKISQLDLLTAADVAVDDDYLPVVDSSVVLASGRNKRMTVTEIAKAVVQNASAYTASGTGALTTDVQTELRSRPINAVTQFGLSTSATAAANYTALSRALAQASSSGKSVYIPAGTYSIDPSSGILTQPGLLFGDGRNKTKLVMAGSGDLFQRPSYSTIADLTIDMVGTTYTGHTCKFATTTAMQADRNIEILNAADTYQALLFEGGGGSQFYSAGSLYHTKSAIGSNAAIKVNGTDSSATPRIFVGTESNGCTLFDFGACNDFFVYGGFSNCLLFSSSSATKVHITNLRVGDSSTVTVKGVSHKIKGCTFAGAVVLDSSTQNVDFDNEVTNTAITDSGITNSVRIPTLTYTPTWTATVGSPTFGNASVSARYSRHGRRVSGDIEITFGSTTSFDSSTQWFFSLPYTPTTGAIQIGAAMAIDASTSNYRSATAVISPSDARVNVRVQNDGGSSAVQSTVPWTWAQSDILRIHFDFIAA